MNHFNLKNVYDDFLSENQDFQEVLKNKQQDFFIQIGNNNANNN